MIFAREEMRLIGRKLLGLEWSFPGLGMGTMVEVFQEGGKYVRRRIAFII